MNSTDEQHETIPVVLTIRGEQYFDGTDPDRTELVTEGDMRLTDRGFLLSYQETELTGMEGTVTTFELQDKRVILTRKGSFNSQMVFEENAQHTSLYETPFGDMTVDLQTSFLRHNITKRGGVMEIKYSIAVEHSVTGQNSFRIRVKPTN